MPLALLLLLGACGKPVTQTPDPPPPAMGQAPAGPGALEPLPPMPVNDAGSLTLTMAGAPIPRPDGSTVVPFETVFLGDDLKNAEGTLILWLEDIEAENGSSATFYLGNNTEELFDEADYVGSFATMGGSPTHFRRTQLEIHDSHGDVDLTPLTTLRSLASFSIVMVVHDGSVSVGRITLFAKQI